MSYNVAGGSSLAGLNQLVISHKPDYIFLQEVVVSTEQLEAHLGRKYRCQVNTDSENEKQPGTAIAWKSDLKVEVEPVVMCRMQRMRSTHGHFINVYPSTGTRGEAERRILFTQDLMRVIAVDPDTILVGDWNCIVRKDDE